MITHRTNPQQSISYRLPTGLVATIVWALISREKHSFAEHAQWALEGVHPGMVVLGKEYIPPTGACLVTCNHYSRSGFNAWWIALGISAAIAACRAPGADLEIHWVMTAAWTFQNNWLGGVFITPVTRWIFSRIASVYGFVTMPPMPPNPAEVGARAIAIRKTLRLAQQAVQSGGMVGLAPEGRDTSGLIGEPPPGAGEFLAKLVETGLPILPVGISERTGRLSVSFGPLYTPQIPSRKKDRDTIVSRQVMMAITSQLP